MKIGVIGTKMMPDIIGRSVEAELPDIQFVYRCSEFFEASAELADGLQKSREVDAILFSGRTGYEYAHNRVVPTIPWAYLAHSRTAAFRACLEGMAVYHSDLKSISIDRFDPALLQEALEDVGIEGATILCAPASAEEPNFESRLLDFHRECYRQGRVSICFTSMEHIAEPLRGEGIPCVRIYPVKEAVQEQVYHLQILHFSARRQQGAQAVVALRLNHRFYGERDLMFQEWEMVRCQSEFKERVCTLAQRMDAAVFSGDGDQLFIATARSTLMNVFLKDQTFRELGLLRVNFPSSRVWFGIGVGSTMLEAKSRAMTALNRSVDEGANKSYWMETELAPLDIKLYDSDAGAENDLSHLVKTLHMNTGTLKKVIQVLQASGDTLTSHELARQMQLTLRSTNRIIARLEEAGYATVVGKQSTGPGRPTRLIKISLPESLFSGGRGEAE